MDEKLHFNCTLYMVTCCLAGLLCIGRLVAALPQVSLLVDATVLSAVLVPYQLLAVRMQTAMAAVSDEEGYHMQYLEGRHDALDDWLCLGFAAALIPPLAEIFLRMV
jgi:hypothetical protein